MEDLEFRTQTLKIKLMRRLGNLTKLLSHKEYLPAILSKEKILLKSTEDIYAITELESKDFIKKMDTMKVEHMQYQ